MDKPRSPYQGARRKTLTPPGLQPPPPVDPAPLAPAPPSPPGSLAAEIDILRQSMRDLAAARHHAVTVADQLRLSQALSLVGERLAQMLLANQKLTQAGGGELEAWLRQQANEVLREHGWEVD
jgi:hypothetical protein